MHLEYKYSRGLPSTVTIIDIHYSITSPSAHQKNIEPEKLRDPTTKTRLIRPPSHKMNSQVWQPTRRVVVKAVRSAPSTTRGASSATSNLPFHRYASQGLRQLARQHRETKAPADWMGLIRNATWGLPV